MKNILRGSSDKAWAVHRYSSGNGFVRLTAIYKNKLYTDFLLYEFIASKLIA